MTGIGLLLSYRPPPRPSHGVPKQEVEKEQLLPLSRHRRLFSSFSLAQTKETKENDLRTNQSCGLTHVFLLSRGGEKKIRRLQCVLSEYL